MAEPPSLRISLGESSASFAGADHHQPGNFEPLGNGQFQRRADFAGEALGLGSPSH